MKYKVLIIIKDKWYSDQREFDTFADAKCHEKKLAAKWSDGKTVVARSCDVLTLSEAEQKSSEGIMNLFSGPPIREWEDEVLDQGAAMFAERAAKRNKSDSR
jgi:hypothetical protein